MTDPLAALKQHFDFETWFGRNQLDHELFVWKYRLDPQVFPGWENLRTKFRVQEGYPDTIDSIWRLPGEGLERLLKVDIYECDSRAHAHDFLLEQLNSFMSPNIVRRDELAIGDVAFGEPGPHFLLFSRANLVISLFNGGRDLVSVPELALGLDQSLFQIPPSEPIPLLAELNLPVFDPGSLPAIPLDLGGLQLPDGVGHLRFFSSTGAVSRDGERFVYQAVKAGLQEALLYLIP